MAGTQRSAFVFAITCLIAAVAGRKLLQGGGLTSATLPVDAGGSIKGVSQGTNIGGQFTSSGGTHYPGKYGQSIGTGSSSGNGDPIFEGFDGRTFEFFGKVGGTYNLLSERHHQLSTHLKFAQMWDHNGTYMDAFSLRYRGHDLTVRLTEDDSLSVVLDGAALKMGPDEVEMEEILGLMEGELHVHWHLHKPNFGNAIKATTETLGLLVWVTPAGTHDEGGLEQPAYLNFDLQLRGPPVNNMLKGVIGHTYSEDMEEDLDDFEFHHQVEDFEMASFSETGRAHMLYDAAEPTVSLK